MNSAMLFYYPLPPLLGARLNLAVLIAALSLALGLADARQCCCQGLRCGAAEAFVGAALDSYPLHALHQKRTTPLACNFSFVLPFCAAFLGLECDVLFFLAVLQCCLVIQESSYTQYSVEPNCRVHITHPWCQRTIKCTLGTSALG